VITERLSGRRAFVGRDPHSALKTEVIAKTNPGSMEVVLARLQWGKDDSRYSLHVNPTSFSTAGLQRTDFLAYLGFGRSDQCSFTTFQRCYVKWVDEGFNIEEFGAAFDRAFTFLERAERGLESCGFALPQPEGWGFFSGRTGGRSYREPTVLSGDGHTARQIRSMKQTEDDTFLFRFTFLETDREKGFVAHYRPKHPPLSFELSRVFSYLGLEKFDECPEFGFDPCHFRTLLYQTHGDSVFDNNTEYAHRAFDAHAGQFSPAIQDLLASNVEIERIGLTFLPLAELTERMKAVLATNVIRPLKSAPRQPGSKPAVVPDLVLPENFDVAISFAGTEREHAHELAEQVRAAGFAVFYDDFYPEHLWGKDLSVFFDEVFRKKSRFCVVFISQEYRDRKWTIHEVRSAQARAIEEKGNEYILPIKVDDAELNGMRPTLGYVPIEMGIEKIGELLIKKLRS
jgi:hypothetical protein